MKRAGQGGWEAGGLTHAHRQRHAGDAAARRGRLGTDGALPGEAPAGQGVRLVVVSEPGLPGGAGLVFSALTPGPPLPGTGRIPEESVV